MYRFAHVKHFGCGRNFEPLRNCETKGFEFFHKIKFSKQWSIKKERNTSILLYHTFQQLRQDLPKLMIPQELSTSYGIKLMLANMWDAELWSSLWHMVNFIIQKRLQQKIWTLWNNLEWGEWERSANQRWWLALSFAIGTESRVHLWSHGCTLSFKPCPPPRSDFATLGAENWAPEVVVSFDLSAFNPGSGSFRQLCLLFGHLSPSLKG